MKTPVSILQELMMKRGEQPQYELVYSGGTANNPVFRMSVMAASVKVEAEGRSKKIAKQQVAVVALSELARNGINHPEHQGTSDCPMNEDFTPPILINNIIILKDYTSDYNLPVPEYDLVNESGPPHLREFVMNCTVGTCIRHGTGPTKKQARQVAAGKVLDYLRKNLTYIISEIEDDQAVVLNEKAAKIFAEKCPDVVPWRPNLGMQISEYHNGLKEFVGETKCTEAFKFLLSQVYSTEPLARIDKLLSILELEYEWIPFPTNNGDDIMMLNIPHCHPPITVCGMGTGSTAKTSAAACALEHMADILL